jgi:hypothetical protein
LNESNDDDDFSNERLQFRQAAGRASPPFLNFPFPASEEPRHFKDRALNLAMEFNGERVRRGLHPRPISPMLGAPKPDDGEDRKPPSPANNESASNETGSGQGPML